MNVMDMVKECVKNSNNSQNVTAVVALSDGRSYKLRDMCDLGEVKKDLKVLFFGTDGNIYCGYTDGEKYEDELLKLVLFYVKVDPKDKCYLSMPEKYFYGWAYDEEYYITTWGKIKSIVNKLRRIKK